ncbi:MAG: clan AA aspartic protease [Bacteroidaceae bacterium]|nr:clan AA aspartic protease [Bacteroidaceae bacterium]
MIQYYFRRISLIFLLGLVCCKASAQDVNEWLEAQLNASVNLRHVDYEEMYAKALQEDKGVVPLTRCLIVVDYCRAYGLDSLAKKMADFVLENASNQQMENGIAAYLLNLKYRLALLQNRYDEIEQMACYVDKRWQDKQRLKDKAIHWHRLAAAGKDIQPVSIQRSKNVVGMAFERDSVGHVCIRADVNKTKNQRFIVDTGMMSSTIILRKYANQIGVRLLPDSTRASSAMNPGVIYNMQLGIVDSLRIDGIKFCNLPVWVSDETGAYDCMGFIGTPDLSRLEYMELSKDSIVFRYPLPEQEAEANFTMNAGDKGERCICLPCTLDGHKSSLILDTGSNIFLLPKQYAERKDGFFAEVGGMKMWFEAGMLEHAYVPYPDSRGFWGQPLLWSFIRLCFNFRDAHVDYIRKKDVEYIEYLNKIKQ